MPFSPLIIGEVPSTPGGCSVTCTTRLQSPHHRGGALNESWPPLEVRLDLQSPHHRGGALNRTSASRTGPTLTSVPSSSGRCPQHDSSTGPRRSTFFSPLIIGEVPSTHTTPHSVQEKEDLQSPHHRGGALNSPAAASAAVPSFSPLIIGEVPSTKATTTTEISNLQSPHHRGGALNIMQLILARRINLQSPHHRGGALNQHIRKYQENESLQSPHHRGGALNAGAG